jgi:arsenate reductase
MKQFIYYPKCSTCQKALKRLDSTYELRDITKQTPTKEELKQYIIKYNKGIKPFFNTSGKIYREMNLKDKVNSLTIDEAVELLSQNCMLIKRPILINDDTILVGYKEKEYDLL